MPAQPQDHKQKHERHPQAEVSGKVFTWSPKDEDDELGNLKPVTLKLRIKVTTLREIAGLQYDNAADAMKILDALAPEQFEEIGEMDMLELVAMMQSFMDEYAHLHGAALGE